MVRARQGGGCQFTWFAGKHGPHGGPITSGYCGIGKPVRAQTFAYAYEYEGSPRIRTTCSRDTRPGAVRMRIGKRFFKTPFGWFVAMYKRPELLTA